MRLKNIKMRGVCAHVQPTTLYHIIYHPATTENRPVPPQDVLLVFLFTQILYFIHTLTANDR